ncbi:hypothetical protein HD553DRAFT_320567 [Filobasidium floriforme]|uniref:uncharacterized protein n=1 Tax=Filobasidium floriforme TaxID=5210 RepID=UPI001E8E59BC|nr:uncharacterized protein HD553DRAFT_320567 [Filobasidium floriforme]KAH8077696.1 hypothetical protein HD553DRAFT_320567 [Filobasidium floriforme]
MVLFADASTMWIDVHSRIRQRRTISFTGDFKHCKMVTYLLWLVSEGDSQPSSNDKGIAYSPVEIGHGFSVMLKQAETDEYLDVGLPPGYRLHSYLWKEGRGAYRYEHRVYDRTECSRWSCMELREALEGIQPVVYATIFRDLDDGGQMQKDFTHVQDRRHKQSSISVNRLTQKSNVRKRSPTRTSRIELRRTMESLDLTGQLEPSYVNTQSSQDKNFAYSRSSSANISSPSGTATTTVISSSLFDGVCIQPDACPAEEGIEVEM